MAKEKRFFSLAKVADKVSSGMKKQFLLELQSIMCYKSYNNVYLLLRRPGVRNLDIMKYRAINALLGQYGCSEEDWEITISE